MLDWWNCLPARGKCLIGAIFFLASNLFMWFGLGFAWSGLWAINAILLLGAFLLPSDM